MNKKLKERIRIMNEKRKIIEIRLIKNEKLNDICKESIRLK